MCVYVDIFGGSLSVCVPICIRWNVCIYVWMCLCFYVFICMQVWRERERESGRYVPGGQFNCCYSSPRSSNVSYKQNLTLPVVKHWQAKCHNQRRQRFVDVLRVLFENWFFYTYLATILKTIKIFYRKKLNSCFSVLSSLARNWKYVEAQETKTIFLMFSACFFENWFLHLFSYPYRNEQDCLQEKMYLR